MPPRFLIGCSRRSRRTGRWRRWSHTRGWWRRWSSYNDCCTEPRVSRPPGVSWIETQRREKKCEEKQAATTSVPGTNKTLHGWYYGSLVTSPWKLQCTYGAGQVQAIKWERSTTGLKSLKSAFPQGHRHKYHSDFEVRRNKSNAGVKCTIRSNRGFILFIYFVLKLQNKEWSLDLNRSKERERKRELLIYINPSQLHSGTQGYLSSSQWKSSMLIWQLYLFINSHL